eukprot:2557552-Prymnesium_polylepis.1
MHASPMTTTPCILIAGARVAVRVAVRQRRCGNGGAATAGSHRARAWYRPSRMALPSERDRA